MKQKLIIIRGPLGVGKTTVSKHLATKLGVEYISLDKIIADNNLETENGIPLANFLKANEIIFQKIKTAQNTHIIDGCFYYQEQIEDLKLKFPHNLTIFTLISDIEKCIERDAKREKVYGEDSARFVYMMTTKIKAGYEIDNSNLTLEETVEKILKKLSNLV